MNARAHKRHLANAQRAWSRTNITTGWVPLAWYKPRHPRIVASRPIPTTFGSIDRITFVQSAPSFPRLAEGVPEADTKAADRS